MWKVLLSPDVNDFLNKQDKNIKERLRKSLEKLKTDKPFRYLEHFESESLYKYRIGDYRALIDVDFNNKILRIQVLDKRGRIYR